MPRPEKVTKVEEIKTKFQSSPLAIVVNSCGLSVNQVNNLRVKLRSSNSELKVYKNTMACIAIADTTYQAMDKMLSGPTSIVFCSGDPVSPAKVLLEYAKENEKFEIKGGALDGQVITLNDIKDLSNLPSREELIAKIVGSIASPLYGLVNVLQGPLRKLVYVMQAIADQKTK